MELPNHITFIRHGESESNVAQRLGRANKTELIDSAFDNRHDSEMRLSFRGAEQAKAAGEWLRENDSTSFDEFFVSPYVRARETAAGLRLGGSWKIDDIFRERDYGEHDTHKLMSEKTKVIRQKSEYYWKPKRGESRATDLHLRAQKAIELLRSDSDKTLVVTHGEFMRQVQVIFEGLTPDRAERLIKDPDYTVYNGMIVQYTKVNPNDKTDIRPAYAWRRGVCPWDDSLSWDNGEWINFGAAKTHSDTDLLSYVENFERLISEELMEHISQFISHR